VIDFHFAPTPNGWKVAILLEELGLPYNMIPVRLGKGDQFKPEFLAISPNNRMPAIVDHDVPGDPVPIFESGAIMWYLAEKAGKYLPTEPLGRKEAMEWLFWQVGNQGPMAGQLSHFVNYAPEGIGDYGHQRYAREYDRCLGVLERRLQGGLEGRDYILGDYSIADMICWPWVLIAKPLGASLAPFPNVTAWRSRIKDRPAVRRAVDLGKEMRRSGPPTDAERKMLYEQTAASVGKLSDENA
jgi:GST-like protein